MTIGKAWKVVGTDAQKLDGLGLATGRRAFTADLVLKDQLVAKILPSPHAHARIRDIRTGRAEALPGVRCVLTYKNVPRVLHTTAGQGAPEPSPYDTVLFDHKVRFVGDRVAAVAAVSEEVALQALALIEVDYEVLPAVFDPEEALREGAPVIHDEPDAHAVIPVTYEPERNRASYVEAKVGDVEKGLAAADAKVEGCFVSHYAQHCPMEPHVVLCYLDEDGRLVIRTSTQVPFHVRRIVALVLQIPVKQIRVIKPRIGGGFGAKQEVMLEQVCAMLTLRTGKPVLLNYTREEEFVSSRTRHPQVTQLRIGAKKDGTLTAIDLSCLNNTGAYGSHALTVVCNSGSKVLPLYRSKNVKFMGQAAYTNLPVAGAYRGYGATQAAFAMESLMDELAEKLKIDPVILRKKNHIRTGEGSPIFEALGEGRKGVPTRITSCGLDQCITLGAERLGFSRKRRKPGKGEVRRGVGMACLMQGSSIPHIDMGAATIKMNEDGSFNLLVGATDLGTGSDTILAQIAAEVLGIRVSDIVVYSSDTDLTPFDVGAYASSTTFLSGKAVEKAALAAREQILGAASRKLGVPQQKLTLAGGMVVGPKGKKVPLGEIACYTLYEKDQFQVMGTASHITETSPPPFSAHFAEVEVDTGTGRIEVKRYVAAVDCGTAINPLMARGQTEGAVLNGISFALTEQYHFDAAGRMLNPNFKDYKIFSSRDVPTIEVILVPTYEPAGPYGAKSVSEISINGPLPAIANAVYDAVGIRLREPPFTPEKVLKALGKL